MTATRNPHACVYGWCVLQGNPNADSREHWWLQYVPATGRAFAPPRSYPVKGIGSVGTGVEFEPSRQLFPTVTVHIIAREGEDDVSLDMTATEAIWFRALLDKAIDDAIAVTPDASRLDVQIGGR